MKPSVYIETTIPSYLTAWSSPQLLMAANQQVTRVWWDNERHKFDLYISEIVMYEARCGDANAVSRRLEALTGLSELAITQEVESLAGILIAEHVLPEQSKDDALHISIASVYRVDYLLTWNCKHIANAVMRPTIERTCRVAGYEPPVICTPQELMDGV